MVGSTEFTAVLLGIGGAQAQVTPEEVWANWQQMSASYGQAIVSTSAVRDGDTLCIAGAAITMDNEKGSKLDAQLGEFNFSDLGDGTVKVMMAERYLISIAVVPTGTTEKPANLSVIVTQPGLKMVVGGSSTETNYMVTVPTLNVKVDEARGRGIHRRHAGRYYMTDVAVDITDSAQTAAMGVHPGELHALELSELKARIAGEELTGSGAATFDNSDLTTYGGVPKPTGKVDLKQVGANILLDNLIAMGLVTQELAMGFWMGASMFTTVGDGEDTLTSMIEFKDKYANGQ